MTSFHDSHSSFGLVFQSCCYRMLEAIPVEARGRALIDSSENDVSTRFLRLFETIQIFGWKIWARTWITFSFGVMARQMVCWILWYALMWHLCRNRYLIYKLKLLKATAVLPWDYSLDCWQGVEVPLSLLPSSTRGGRNGAFPTRDTYVSVLPWKKICFNKQPLNMSL